MMTSSLFSIYIHWPFCESKCPYCDFNSHVLKSISEESWMKGIIQELQRYRSILDYKTVKSIFFGGGTPSLISGSTIERIIQTIQKLWSLSPNCEITLEANPSSSEASRFQDYKSAGVNRLSIGLQALSEKDLKTLGRRHSYTEGIKAYEMALPIFDRISADLIYARPHQTLKEWEKELAFILQYNPTHLSLYQLTIEPGTLFENLYKRGDLQIPHDQLAYDFYKLTHEMTLDAGLHAYEISNYSAPDFESRHNLTYWNYQPYLGVGPGAHSRIHINPSKPHVYSAIHQHKAPLTWQNSLQEHQHADASILELTDSEMFEEQVMVGLRLKKGILKKDLLRPFSHREAKRFEHLIKENYAIETEDYYTLTPSGRLLLNSVLGYFLNTD